MMRALLLGLAGIATASSAMAQEVIVSAQRRGYQPGDPAYSNGVVATSRPIINLRRTADYVVQTVRVGGTRATCGRVATTCTPRFER